MSKHQIFQTWVSHEAVIPCTISDDDYHLITEWLAEVMLTLKIPRGINLNAVQIFNTATMMTSVGRLDYQGYVCMSLYIASILNNYVDILIDDLVYICDELYTNDRLREIAVHILTVTDGKLYIPGPADFIMLTGEKNYVDAINAATLFSIHHSSTFHLPHQVGLASIFLTNPTIDIIMGKYHRKDYVQLMNVMYYRCILEYQRLSPVLKNNLSRVYKIILDFEYDDTIVYTPPSRSVTSSSQSPSALIVPKRLTILGKGTYGTIYRGMVGSVSLAIKSQKTTDLDVSIIELVAMKSLKHMNIQSIRSFSFDATKSYFSMTKQTGSLFDIIGNISPVLQKKIGRGIVNGVQYMHSMGIIHRDIKSGNILLSSSDVPKIADFGMALLHVNQSVIVDTTGTYQYASYDTLLEISQNDEALIDFSYDVWSTGVVLLEMEIGRIPFRGTSDDPDQYLSELIDDIRQKVVVDQLKMVADHDFRLTLRQMLNPDPTLRITINQVTI